MFTLHNIWAKILTTNIWMCVILRTVITVGTKQYWVICLFLTLYKLLYLLHQSLGIMLWKLLKNHGEHTSPHECLPASGGGQHQQHPSLGFTSSSFSHQVLKQKQRALLRQTDLVKDMDLIQWTSTVKDREWILTWSRTSHDFLLILCHHLHVNWHAMWYLIWYTAFCNRLKFLIIIQGITFGKVSDRYPMCYTKQCNKYSPHLSGNIV